MCHVFTVLFVFLFCFIFCEVFKGDDCLVLLFIILYFLLEAFALHVLLFSLLFFNLVLCWCNTLWLHGSCVSLFLFCFVICYYVLFCFGAFSKQNAKRGERLCFVLKTCFAQNEAKTKNTVLVEPWYKQQHARRCSANPPHCFAAAITRIARVFVMSW